MVLEKGRGRGLAALVILGGIAFKKPQLNWSTEDAINNASFDC